MAADSVLQPNTPRSVWSYINDNDNVCIVKGHPTMAHKCQDAAVVQQT